MRFNIHETTKIYIVGFILFNVGSLFGDKYFALYIAMFYAINRLNDLKIQEIKDFIVYGKNRSSKN